MIYLTKDKGYLTFKTFCIIYLYIFIFCENYYPLIGTFYFKYSVMIEADETTYILHYNTEIHHLESGNTGPENMKYLPKKIGAAARNYVECKSNLMNSFDLLSFVLLLSDFSCTFIVHKRILPTSVCRINLLLPFPREC